MPRLKVDAVRADEREHGYVGDAAEDVRRQKAPGGDATQSADIVHGIGGKEGQHKGDCKKEKPLLFADTVPSLEHFFVDETVYNWPAGTAGQKKGELAGEYGRKHIQEEAANEAVDIAAGNDKEVAGNKGD